MCVCVCPCFRLREEGFDSFALSIVTRRDWVCTDISDVPFVSERKLFLRASIISGYLEKSTTKVNCTRSTRSILVLVLDFSFLFGEIWKFERYGEVRYYLSVLGRASYRLLIDKKKREKKYLIAVSSGAKRGCQEEPLKGISLAIVYRSRSAATWRSPLAIECPLISTVVVRAPLRPRRRNIFARSTRRRSANAWVNFLFSPSSFFVSVRKERPQIARYFINGARAS